MEDRELLRQFVIDRSEAAFAELVRRYVDLVYSSALRQMKDSAGAEDVTQSVFVLFAAKARSIHNANALGGWLLTATRGIALNMLRADLRRRRHESEAAAMKEKIQNHPDSQWDDVKEFLDEAVARLKLVDRDALTLRYFQNREVPEMAAALGISPLAAQKRVSRAIARLRDLLARKGIVTSSDALGALLLTHAVSPAPTALSGSITTSALSTAKTIASIQTLKGAATIMAMTNTKAAALVIAAGLIAAAGIAVPIIISKAPSAPVASSPATNPTTNPDAWKTRFNEVYALRRGETLKRIEPPYIPERTEFFNAHRFFPGDNQVPVSYIFRWIDGEAHPSSFRSYDPYMLADLLVAIGGIWPQDTDLSREVAMMDVPGDWIIRDDATQAQKIKVICETALGPGMVLRLEPMERDVIVVSGKLDYRPLPKALSNADWGKIMNIMLYQNSDRIEATAHQICQTQTEFLMQLGATFYLPIVIEAQLGEAKPVGLHMRRDIRSFMQSKQPVDDATMNEILGLVTDQTSLQFTKARRTVPTWRVTQADK